MRNKIKRIYASRLAMSGIDLSTKFISLTKAFVVSCYIDEDENTRWRKITFVFLKAGLRLGSFILRSAQEYRNRQALKQKGAYHIMCVGESTTASGKKARSRRPMRCILEAMAHMERFQFYAKQ